MGAGRVTSMSDAGGGYHDSSDLEGLSSVLDLNHDSSDLEGKELVFQKRLAVQAGGIHWEAP